MSFYYIVWYIYVLTDYVLCICVCRRTKVSASGNETLGFEAGILKLLKKDPALEHQDMAERHQKMEQDRLDRELHRELKLAESHRQEENMQAQQRLVEMQTEANVRHAQQSVTMENMMAYVMKRMMKDNQ
jgi:hypothetical protein